MLRYLYRSIRTICNVIPYLQNFFAFKLRGFTYPIGAKLNGRVLLFTGRGAIISFGNNVTINSSIKANPAGGKHEHTILAISSNASFSIGNRSGISNSTIYCKESIHIGDDVNIGVDSVISDCDSHSIYFNNRIRHPDPDIKTSPIFISDGVWVCANCMILKGVTIGERSVIAAGSIVTHDIPSDELWGGGTSSFYKTLKFVT